MRAFYWPAKDTRPFGRYELGADLWRKLALEVVD
jgi:hypothetical protein